MRRAVFHFRLFTHTAQSAPVHRAVLLGKCVSTSANCHFNWNLLSVCLFHLTIVLLNLATHTLNMVERPHSLIHIYLYTQTGFYEAVRGTGLFNIADHKQRFISMHDSRAGVSSGVPKQKRKTIGENWYKRTQLPKKYRSDHSKRKKKMTSVFFQRFTIFILLLCVYIFGGSEFFLNKYPNGMQREVRRKKLHWQE